MGDDDNAAGRDAGTAAARQTLFSSLLVLADDALADRRQEVRRTVRDSHGGVAEPGGPPSRPSAAQRARDRRRRTLMVLGALILAWLGSGLPPQTWIATVAVAIPALGVLAVAMRHPRDLTPDATRAARIDRAGRADRVTATPPRLRLALTCWCALFIVAAAWELWVFLRQPAWNVPNPDMPTVTVALGPAFEHRIVRFGAWLVWLYTGCRLAR